ncbi:ferritin-like domain-containing protein [Stackebrandtia soli]|uniref:ferritin-like domain-containing protein n=1 Tax=Stackebrandtia soli TaxID=1892856 RepID=UPI0039E79A99
MTEDGLIAALSVEFEAVYMYTEAVPHLSKPLRGIAADAEQAHRNLRDMVLVALNDAGKDAPAAAAGYRMPTEPTDEASSIVVISTTEDKAAQVWRAALATTTGDERRVAVEGLSAVARLAATWRRALDESPSVPAFPGRP